METVRIEKIGRFTIVKVMETVIEDLKEVKYTGIGIARLSDKDSYKKELAEKIALGRAVNALEMKKQGREIHNSLMG